MYWLQISFLLFVNTAVLSDVMHVTVLLGIFLIVYFVVYLLMCVVFCKILHLSLACWHLFMCIILLHFCYWFCRTSQFIWVLCAFLYGWVAELSVSSVIAATRWSQVRRWFWIMRMHVIRDEYRRQILSGCNLPQKFQCLPKLKVLSTMQPSVCC